MFHVSNFFILWFIIVKVSTAAGALPQPHFVTAWSKYMRHLELIKIKFLSLLHREIAFVQLCTVPKPNPFAWNWNFYSYISDSFFFLIMVCKSLELEKVQYIVFICILMYFSRLISLESYRLYVWKYNLCFNLFIFYLVLCVRLVDKATVLV